MSVSWVSCAIVIGRPFLGCGLCTVLSSSMHAMYRTKCGWVRDYKTETKDKKSLSYGEWSNMEVIGESCRTSTTTWGVPVGGLIGNKKDHDDSTQWCSCHQPGG